MNLKRKGHRDEQLRFKYDTSVTPLMSHFDVGSPGQFEFLQPFKQSSSNRNLNRDSSTNALIQNLDELFRPTGENSLLGQSTI